MKKIFAATLFVGLASMAQAAFIQCQPDQGTVVNDANAGQVVYSCDPGLDNINGDGLTIVGIQLRLSGTFQENNGPTGQAYSVLYSSTNDLGLAGLSDPSCTANAVADSNNQALGQCISTTAFAPVAGNPDSIGSFTVTVNGGPGSDPLPFNASASVFYMVQTARPPDVIPEPSTYLLLGLGLSAFAFFKRK